MARSVLGCHESVEAVMILGEDGRILAYERAIGPESDFPDEEYPLLSYSSGSGMIFFVRLNAWPRGEEIRDRVERTIGHPYLPLSR
jgi:hypothetical protein